MSNPTDSSDIEIVTECDLPDPPEKVWRALTVPELLAAWLMPNDIRPRVGERFRFQPEPIPLTEPGAGLPTTRPSTGEQGPRAAHIADSIDCEVLEVQPYRLLRYRWSEHENEGARELRVDSVLSFELTPTQDGGTHLRVVHGEFRVASVVRLPARRTCPPALRTRKDPVALAGWQTRIWPSWPNAGAARTWAEAQRITRWAA
jgi:uncharacterized protein YndB with AHSA1/START domain